MPNSGLSVLALQLAGMNRLTAAGGPLAAAVLQLFSNDLDPNVNTLLADLVEATFDGYAEEAAYTLGGAYIDTDGQIHLTGPSKLWTATGTTVTETIFGWMLLNTAGTALYLAGRFPNPIPITAIGDGVFVAPDLVWGG